PEGREEDGEGRAERLALPPAEEGLVDERLLTGLVFEAGHVADHAEQRARSSGRGGSAVLPAGGPVKRGRGCACEEDEDECDRTHAASVAPTNAPRRSRGSSARVDALCRPS